MLLGVFDGLGGGVAGVFRHLGGVDKLCNGVLGLCRNGCHVGRLVDRDLRILGPENLRHGVDGHTSIFGTSNAIHFGLEGLLGVLGGSSDRFGILGHAGESVHLVFGCLYFVLFMLYCFVFFVGLVGKLIHGVDKLVNVFCLGRDGKDGKGNDGA